MRLSAKPIINWANVNDFDTTDQWIIRAGEPNTLYLQLVDLDQKGLRYVAGVGVSNQPVSLQVIFPSIDSTLVIQVAGAQDANDGSIWSFDLTSLQSPFSGNVQFSLTQGSVVRSFSVLNMMSVEYPDNQGSDCAIPDVNAIQ